MKFIYVSLFCVCWYTVQIKKNQTINYNVQLSNLTQNDLM